MDEFNNAQCGNWSKKELSDVLKEHIQTVVRHGGDTYYSWEVVNEPTNPTHNGCWSRVLGDDEYMVKAFQYAREANPNALLLLNDTFGQGGIDKERVDEFFSIGRSREEKGRADRCHRHGNALGTAGNCGRTTWTNSRLSR